MNISLSLSIIGLVISLIATSIFTLLVARQITFQRHANQIPVSINIEREYRSLEFQASQDYVINKLSTEHNPSLGITNLPRDARAHVTRVMTFFSGLGALVFYNTADEKYVVSLLGYRINKAWEVLEPYIYREREILETSHFLVFYEDLVCRIRENWPPAKAYGFKLKSLKTSSHLGSDDNHKSPYQHEALSHNEPEI